MKYRLEFKTPLKTEWLTVEADNMVMARILGRQRAAKSWRYGWEFVGCHEVVTKREEA